MPRRSAPRAPARDAPAGVILGSGVPPLEVAERDLPFQTFRWWAFQLRTRLSIRASL
jgi:hypothetical protein